MSNQPKHITENCYHPVEIAIGGAGSVVEIEKALPLLYDKVEGVTVFHPGGSHGSGSLKLAVAGEEIFPKGFHARAFMLKQSSHYQKPDINKDFDHYLYKFEERAKGASISATYTEPSNGTNGVMFLIFKLTRSRPCR